MNLTLVQGRASAGVEPQADRRSPINRGLHKAITFFRIAEFRAAERVPADELHELSTAINMVVDALRIRLSPAEEIEIAAPTWCECGALIPTRAVIDLPLPVGIWWTPDETPPSGVYLLVAVRDDNGQVYRDLAEYDRDTQTWRFVGDLTRTQPCHPLAWCYLPSLPRWLQEAP